MKKIVNIIIKTCIPLCLGAVILVWIYRDFDFSQLGDTLAHNLNLWWFGLSLFFGIFSHILRGWRWRLTLSPLGYHPKKSDCVYAVFVSYAANLVIPRVGEVSRCAVLDRYDGVSFSKSLGTVVTERLVDTLSVALLAVFAFLLQGNVFLSFFSATGTNGEQWVHLFTSQVFIISAVCTTAVLVLVFLLIRHLSFYSKVKGVLRNVWEGILSLRNVKRPFLFLLETVAIWGCYFLQFYLCFFCFDFSSGLSFIAGLVLFVAGSIAVVVPTPNGAGAWHFAIISMMVLYGVSVEDAGMFALIVHSSQTLLVLLLGMAGLLMLQFNKKHSDSTNNK